MHLLSSKKTKAAEYDCLNAKICFLYLLAQLC